MVRKPASGQLGAVVQLRRPGGGSVESAAFRWSAANRAINSTSAARLSGSGSADVEVALIDRGGGAAPSGAELSIGRAQFVTRLTRQSGRIALRARSTMSLGVA